MGKPLIRTLFLCKDIFDALPNQFTGKMLAKELKNNGRTSHPHDIAYKWKLLGVIKSGEKRGIYNKTQGGQNESEEVQ